MKTTIHKKDLADAMKSLKHTLHTNNANLPVLASMKMEANAVRQEVVLATTDLETHLQIVVPGKVERPGETLIIFRSLERVLKMCESQITFEEDAENRGVLTIQSGKGSCHLDTLPAEEFPSSPTGPRAAHDMDGWSTVNAEVLHTLLQRSAFAASINDETRLSLKQVRIVLRGNRTSPPDEIVMEATDGHRAVRTKLVGANMIRSDGRHEEHVVFLPRKTEAILRGRASDVILQSWTEETGGLPKTTAHYTELKAEGLCMVHKELRIFPDLDAVLPMSGTKLIGVPLTVKTTAQALSSIRPTKGGDTKLVLSVLPEDQILLAREGARLRVDTAAKIKPAPEQPVEIPLNVHYLAEYFAGLKATKATMSHMEFDPAWDNDGYRAILFRTYERIWSKTDLTTVYVVMPLRA